MIKAIPILAIGVVAGIAGSSGSSKESDFLNETHSLGSAHLCCSSAPLRSVAVLFILAFHGWGSIRRAQC
jgi:hypothetical protein